MKKANPAHPIILSIETSLDDTCAAVTMGRRVLSNIISSQTNYHEKFGGTVPHLAKRLHQELLPSTIEEAIRRSGVNITQIDAVAVTHGPGLAPALEQGIKKAKELAQSLHKPLIAVNHLEGHLLSPLAQTKVGSQGVAALEYPSLGFIISGGHTELVLVHKIGSYQLLGETLDDAAGEAYDKVARMLSLGYPGGPILSELAKYGNPIYQLPIPMQSRRDLNFSFSGLKTAARYKLEELKPRLTKNFIADFAASFEHAVLTHLADRFERAVLTHHPNSILLGGGVVHSVSLRRKIRRIAKKHHLPTHIPYSKSLFTDNAAMIGVVAYYTYLRKNFADAEKLDRLPNLNFLVSS